MAVTVYIGQENRRIETHQTDLGSLGLLESGRYISRTIEQLCHFAEKMRCQEQVENLFGIRFIGMIIQILTAKMDHRAEEL